MYTAKRTMPKEQYYAKVEAIYSRYIPKEDEELTEDIKKLLNKCIKAKRWVKNRTERAFIDTDNRMVYNVRGQAVMQFRH